MAKQLKWYSLARSLALSKNNKVLPLCLCFVSFIFSLLIEVFPLFRRNLTANRNINKSQNVVGFSSSHAARILPRSCTLHIVYSLSLLFGCSMRFLWMEWERAFSTSRMGGVMQRLELHFASIELWMRALAFHTHAFFTLTLSLILFHMLSVAHRNVISKRKSWQTPNKKLTPY